MRQRLQVASILLSLLALHVSAQSLVDGCLYLTGSSVCPEFQSYISVESLADDYPFFSSVTDVASFDKEAEAYFTDSGSGGWVRTMFEDDLGCDNAQNAALRWQRTVMCSTWAFNTASATCQRQLLGTDNTPGVCGATCAQYAESAKQLTQNTEYCSAKDSTGNRAKTLSSLASSCYQVSGPDSDCVTGESNEPNYCGFANTAEACSYCSSSTGSSDTCCSSISGCSSTSGSGSATQSGSSSPTGTKSNSKAGSSKGGISGGAIAGIVIGVVAGLVLIGLLVFCLMRRRRAKTHESHLLHSPSEKLERRASTPMSVPEDHDHFAAESRTPAFNSAAPGAGMTGTGAEGRSAAMNTAGAGLAGVGAAAVAGSMASNAHHTAPTSTPAAPASAPAPVATSAAAVPALGPGSTATVVYPYSAALDDELTLEPGMKINVQEIFDDGWATGTAQSGGPVAQLGKLGKFPMVCVRS